MKTRKSSFLQVSIFLMSAALGTLVHAAEKESGGKLSVLGASQLSVEAIYDYLTAKELFGADVIAIEKLGLATDGSQIYLLRYSLDQECLIQKFHVSVSCYIDTDRPEKGLYKHATPVDKPLSCASTL
jgi:hypothetical protein